MPTLGVSYMRTFTHGTHAAHGINISSHSRSSARTACRHVPNHTSLSSIYIFSIKSIRTHRHAVQRQGQPSSGLVAPCSVGRVAAKPGGLHRNPVRDPRLALCHVASPVLISTTPHAPIVLTSLWPAHPPPGAAPYPPSMDHGLLGQRLESLP